MVDMAIGLTSCMESPSRLMGVGSSSVKVFAILYPKFEMKLQRDKKRRAGKWLRRPKSCAYSSCFERFRDGKVRGREGSSALLRKLKRVFIRQKPSAIE